MTEIHAFPKKVGNSWAVLIPMEKAAELSLDKETELHIQIEAIPRINSLIGTFKSKKSTEKLMEEAKKGWKY